MDLTAQLTQILAAGHTAQARELARGVGGEEGAEALARSLILFYGQGQIDVMESRWLEDWTWFYSGITHDLCLSANLYAAMTRVATPAPGRSPFAFPFEA